MTKGSFEAPPSYPGLILLELLLLQQWYGLSDPGLEEAVDDRLSFRRFAGLPLGIQANVVHYNSDSTRPAAEETGAAVKKAGANAFAIHGDLARVAENKRLFAEAKNRFGSVDISVNALGPGPMEALFLYGQEAKESASYNQNMAAPSKNRGTSLTDIAPIVRFLVTEGWWIAGQRYRS